MMTETSKYLAMLAKVMQNNNFSEASFDKEKYNKLYTVIHSELNSELRKSIYPYTSDVIQKTEAMLDAVESLYVFPEITGKKSMLISGYLTTNVFDICKDLFLDKEYINTFEKLYTQIPIVIFDDDDESSLEISNYANVRIKLTLSELKFLILESGKRKIALNKIIKFIILKTKLSEPKLCLIADNIYKNAEEVFSRSISCKVAYLDDNVIETPEKINPENFDALIVDGKNIEKLKTNEKFKQCQLLTFKEIYNFVKENVFPVLYGFTDEYMSVANQIIYYYEIQTDKSRNILKSIKSDITRLEAEDDSTLKAMKENELKHFNKLETEGRNIKILLKDIEALVSEISEEFDDNFITGKKIPRSVLDDLFEAFFKCRNFNDEFGKKIISRIYSYEYDNCELLNAYIQYLAGIKVPFAMIDIKDGEWEKAKMIISITDPEEIPLWNLNVYLNVLGKRCETAKELYAKALIAPEGKGVRALQKSFDKGYEKAGLKLLEMYKSGNNVVNLNSLANALVPEACMMMAEQQSETGKYVDLSDKKFTYYKIAATKQHLPAIGMIVDLVYESLFLCAFETPWNFFKNEKEKTKNIIHNGILPLISGLGEYEKIREDFNVVKLRGKYGDAICSLCQFLIQKEYNTKHYREILGIALFCLNKKLSTAMQLLVDTDSILAHYCVGNMYEFGAGVSKNYKEAIKHYEKVNNNKFPLDITERLSACRSKLEEITPKSKSSFSYESTSTYTGYTEDYDACFAPHTKILMADGTYRTAENIKIGDCVMVFDHYNGTISTEKIVANVHDSCLKKINNIIHIMFENGTKLDIVKSHAIFDLTVNSYVWLDADNVKDYLGHTFALFNQGKIAGIRLTDYSIEQKETEYYTPISKFHLNVFAEDLLTIPPTNLTVDMFELDENMIYDLTLADKYGITPYEELSSVITLDEYNELPCKYYKAIAHNSNCNIEDLKYVISLYREQLKHSKG